MMRLSKALVAGFFLVLALRAWSQVPPPPEAPTGRETGGSGGGPSEDDRRTLQVASMKREALTRIYQATLFAQQSPDSRMHAPALPDGSHAETNSDYTYYMAYYLMNLCPAGSFAEAKACADRKGPDEKRQTMTRIRTVLSRMQQHLQNATVPIHPPPDDQCTVNGTSHGVDAYSDTGGLPMGQETTGPDTIHLCPDFWVANQSGVTATEEGIRELVHESAHLAGINTDTPENYCYPYNCNLMCSPGDADAWAHLVQCLSDGPKDTSGAAAPRVRHGRHH
jgi:hypothetical protein